MNTIKSLQDLYIKLGGSLTDTYSTIANGIPVSDYTTIPDVIDAVNQKIETGGSGGGIPEVEINFEISQDRQTVTASGAAPSDPVFIAALPTKSVEGWGGGIYKFVALAGAVGSGSDAWTYIDPVDGGIYAIQTNMGSLYGISRLNN